MQVSVSYLYLWAKFIKDTDKIRYIYEKDIRYKKNTKSILSYRYLNLSFYKR
jgi:hypothetical protein